MSALPSQSSGERATECAQACQLDRDGNGGRIAACAGCAPDGRYGRHLAAFNDKEADRGR